MQIIIERETEADAQLAWSLFLSEAFRNLNFFFNNKKKTTTMEDLPREIRGIIFDFLPKSERCMIAVQAVQTNHEDCLFFLEMCGDVDNDKTIQGQDRFWACKDMIPIAKYGWRQQVRGLNFDCVLFWFQHSMQMVNGCLHAEMRFVTDKMGIRRATVDTILCAITHWFFPTCSFRHSIFLQKRLRTVLDIDLDECQVPDCLCHANINRNEDAYVTSPLKC